MDEIIGEINALKSLLRNTDYVALKFAEVLPDSEERAELEAKYGETIAKRKAWRAKINELEARLEEEEE